MDSMEQSQPIVEDSQEQPENTATGGIGGGEEQGVDYEKQYKELQAEYTRLRQSQKPAEVSQEDNDRQDIIRSLKEDYGLMTMEDFKQIESKKEKLTNLDHIISERPELANFKGAILKLGEGEGYNWEKIIKDEFENVPLAAGNPGIVGDSNIPSRTPATKSLKDMSKDEFKRYKKEIGLTNPFKKR